MGSKLGLQKRRRLQNAYEEYKKYEAEPKYEEPKYEEPKYEEPKYEEPKYEEPKEQYVRTLLTQGPTAHL